jgi:hypothetical protein
VEGKGGQSADFRKKDLNGDGFITVDELIQTGELVVVAKGGPQPPPATPAETPAEKPAEVPSTTPLVLDGKPVIPDPGNMAGHRSQINKSFYIQVTGQNDGSICGTDVYTDDSSIATAAVHAGFLTVGQKAIIEVRVLPGEPRYTGSTRFGVTSADYTQYNGSFRIEMVRQQ